MVYLKNSFGWYLLLSKISILKGSRRKGWMTLEAASSEIDNDT